MSKQIDCVLCGLPTSHPLKNDAGDVFCCPACREVSALLAESTGSQLETAVISVLAVVGEKTAVSS